MKAPRFRKNRGVYSCVFVIFVTDWEGVSIMIHKFSMNGVNIVMDVFSGAVHVVDEVVFDIVDKIEEYGEERIIADFSSKYSQEQLNEAIGEIKELAKNEMLFTKDEYENVLANIENRKPVVKALCLHIAHDCNLKCIYCFAEEGEYHGHRSLMSTEVGKAAIDFIIKSYTK